MDKHVERPAGRRSRGRRRYLPALPPTLITVLLVTTAVVAAVSDPKIPEAVGD